MIGQYLHHPESGVTGTVDAQNVHPDGNAVVRIDDHWFFANDLVSANG